MKFSVKAFCFYAVSFIQSYIVTNSLDITDGTFTGPYWWPY